MKDTKNHAETPRLKLIAYTVQKLSKYEIFYGRNAGKYGPEKTPYLDTFLVVCNRGLKQSENLLNYFLGTLWLNQDVLFIKNKHTLQN